jgi:2-methylcitrate dehydratase PrpD
MDAEGLSARIAEHAATVRWEQIPEAARHSAERSLLDAVGVSLAATGIDPASRSFAELIAAEGGAPASTVFGMPERFPAAAAAFANGALAHALDFEDSVDGLPVHPNAQVIPAVLALAEERDHRGQDLLRAIAVGCDLAVRFAAAAGPQMSQAGWYPPPIVGALGAVAGAANLIGLDARRTLDALSLALFQVTASGELKNSPDSLIRGIRDGFAAHAAVRSVQLAERGIRGMDAPLEGRSGFFATYTGGDADLDAMTDRLGDYFHGAAVAFKPWPSCRGTHAFVEAALTMRADVAVDDIDAVVLHGGVEARMLAEPRPAKIAPTTAIDAKFSLPFTVAAALIDRDVTLETFSPAGLERPDVRQLAARIDVRMTEEFGAVGDLSGGRTELRLRDGRILALDVPLPRGNPVSPLSDHDLVAKFLQCAASARPQLAVDRSRSLARTLLAFRHEPSVRAALSREFDLPDTGGHRLDRVPA